MTYDKEAWRASVDNGRIPRDKLAAIYPEQYDSDLGGPAIMHPEAAAAMSTLIQQAWEDGVTELRVKYSYRSYTVQLVKWANYEAGGNLAAQPGTSNHGWAVAVDFTGLTSRALAWLRATSRRYGFIADVASENWHYTYQENLWNGDDMTEAQLEQLRANNQRWAGVLAFDAAWDKDATNPQPPAGKSEDWMQGWKVARNAYNRPKT